MKIVVAAPAPAPGVSPDFQQLRDGLRTLQDELQSWRNVSRQELDQRLAALRDELRPTTTAATDNVLKGLETLSQRVQTLEKEEPLSPEKLAREVQALCRRELLVLDEKLTAQIKILAAASAAPSPAVAAIEKKMTDQAAAVEARLREQEKAVEKLRETMLPPARQIAAPVPTPIELPKIEIPIAEPPKVSILPESPAPAPSVFARFWRYMNSPAIEIPTGRSDDKKPR